MTAIGGPYDEKAATCGNGVMPALACPDNATVDKVFPQTRVVKGASLGRIIGAERDISEHVVSSSGAFQNGTDTHRDNTRKG